VCCSTLQCVVVCCRVLQCVAVCCNVLQCVAMRCGLLQSVAVCCSLLQSSAQFTSTCFSGSSNSRLQIESQIENFYARQRGKPYEEFRSEMVEGAFDFNTGNTATHCNTWQRTATHCNALPRTAAHCNTLQHTATLCNTLQHSATYSIYMYSVANRIRVLFFNSRGFLQFQH